VKKECSTAKSAKSTKEGSLRNQQAGSRGGACVWAGKGHSGLARAGLTCILYIVWSPPGYSLQFQPQNHGIMTIPASFLNRFTLLASLVACAPLSATILHDWNFATLPDGAGFSEVVDVGTVGGVSWLNAAGAPENYNNNSGVLGGVYRMSRAAGTGSPTTLWADIPDQTIESAPVWAVIDFAGWNLITDTDQTIRMDFTTTATGSTVAGGLRIDRSAGASPGLQTATLYGQALGTGGSLTPDSFELAAFRDQPLSVAVMFDKANGIYEVSYFLPGASEFVSLGTGTIDAARNGAALRINFNNSFGGEGEYVDIARIYLTTVQPIPEPATLALLLAALGIGWVALRRRR